MTRLAIIAALVAASLGAVSPASARSHHRAHSRHRTVHHGVRDRSPVVEQLLPHPAGCPPVNFCGCGVALKVFGRQVRDLWLAANWLHFPRAEPQHGMVAVFGRHHVAYIERADGGARALVYDPNSGHHRTRVHLVSIAHATIVNPRL